MKKVHSFTITGMGIVIYGREVNVSYTDAMTYLSTINQLDKILGSGNEWRLPHLDECKLIYNLSTEALLMGTWKGQHLYWLSGDSPYSGEAFAWSEHGGISSRLKHHKAILRPIRYI